MRSSASSGVLCFPLFLGRFARVSAGLGATWLTADLFIYPLPKDKERFTGPGSRAAVSVIVRTRNYVVSKRIPLVLSSSPKGELASIVGKWPPGTETTDVLEHETLAGTLRYFL